MRGVELLGAVEIVGSGGEIAEPQVIVGARHEGAGLLRAERHDLVAVGERQMRLAHDDAHHRAHVVTMRMIGLLGDEFGAELQRLLIALARAERADFFEIPRRHEHICSSCRVPQPPGPTIGLILRRSVVAVERLRK